MIKNLLELMPAKRDNQYCADLMAMVENETALNEQLADRGENL